MLFAEIGEALFGAQWRHGDMSRALGISDRTIRRYANGSMEPTAGVYAALVELVAQRRAAIDAVLPRLRAEAAKNGVE